MQQTSKYLNEDKKFQITELKIPVDITLYQLKIMCLSLHHYYDVIWLMEEKLKIYLSIHNLIVTAYIGLDKARSS